MSSRDGIACYIVHTLLIAINNSLRNSAGCESVDHFSCFDANVK